MEISDVTSLVKFYNNLKRKISTLHGFFTALQPNIDALTRWSNSNEISLVASRTESSERYSAVIRTLAKHDKSDQNNNIERVICFAAREGQAAIVTELLHEGVNVNIKDANGYTPLMYACQENHLETVKILLNHGATIDLESLSTVKHPDIFQLLVEKKCVSPTSFLVKKLLANPDKGPDDCLYIEETLLVWAIENRHSELVDTLLKAGADPSHAIGHGFSPLMFAAWNGDIDTLNKLIKAGANINARNQYGGSTALMWAAEGHQYQAVRTLILAGADIGVTNHNGENVFNQSLRRNDLKMANFIYSGRIIQLHLQLRHAQINEVQAIIGSQKADNINKSFLVSYLFASEQDPFKRLTLLKYAIATDGAGNPTNAMSQYMHISQGLGIRKFFCGEKSWAVSRIKSEIRKIELELIASQIHQSKLELIKSTLGNASINDVQAIIGSLKANNINKSFLVSYLLVSEQDPSQRLALLKYAIATDGVGNPSNGMSQYIHISQGLGFRKFFSGEKSWAVSRIKSEIRKTELKFKS